MNGLPESTYFTICSRSAIGNVSSRQKKMTWSAEARCSSPGMWWVLNSFSFPFSGYTGIVGSTRPCSFTAKSTVQSNPWCLLRTLASIGIDCSLRYSWSAAISTMCLPLPGPSPPA